MVAVNRSIKVSRQDSTGADEFLETIVESIGASRSTPEVQDLSSELAVVSEEVVDFTIPSTPNTRTIRAGDVVEDHEESQFVVKEIERLPFNIILRTRSST